MKNDIYILNAVSDRLIAKEIFDELSLAGFSVFTDFNVLSNNSYAIQIKKIISSVEIIICIISENSNGSYYFVQELKLALTNAFQRDKMIITITNNEKLLDMEEFIKLKEHKVVTFDFASLSHKKDAFSDIVKTINSFYQERLLYDKISYLNKESSPILLSSLIELISLICSEIKTLENLDKNRVKYLELLMAIEKIAENNDALTPQLAQKELSLLLEVNEVIDRQNDDNLFFSALALKMNIINLKIKLNAMMVLNKLDSINSKKIQDEFLPIELSLLKKYHRNLEIDNIDNYNSLERDMILTANNEKVADVYRGFKIITREKSIDNNDNNELFLVAEKINESYQLLQKIENIHLSEFLRCLKTCYERLRAYSEIVGCIEILSLSIERIAEINQKLERIEENETVGVVEKGMKALLGLTLPVSGKYDVFISYKHEDVDIARNVYHYFKSQMVEPFFDKTSLPELSKSEYEESIMNALDCSKHFVVIISDIEYLKSFWIKLEMKTFHLEIVEGRKKESNFLIIASDDVYDYIMKNNKQCLPINYRCYEIFKMSEYKKSIINYLK